MIGERPSALTRVGRHGCVLLGPPHTAGKLAFHQQSPPALSRAGIPDQTLGRGSSGDTQDLLPQDPAPPPKKADVQAVSRDE